MNQRPNKTRGKDCQIIVMLASLICFLFVSGCSGGGGDRFLGVWQSDADHTMTIVKDGDAFIVEVLSYEMSQGKQVAKLQKGTLHFDTPFMGEARFSSDGKTIYFNGMEWSKKAGDELRKK